MYVDWSQFSPVASMSLSDDRQGIVITIPDVVLGAAMQVVYVWVDSYGYVLRVGTTKHSVGARLRQYAPHINRALAGLPSSTPLWEARKWHNAVQGGELTALVHAPPDIHTAAGVVRPYLDIERVMIAGLKPPLNRSHR
ncbi:hypothetical protein [Agrobacterium larrymoorei]|uniref:Uncharacterized protein n=1 Tax=Agrobacterium larrymoorei TaxID=160699 RepID=A0AAF0KCJ5_9HYPH|nr:hypothetical protein [Agrobacterium larrymoorei]WHA40165.1 hypothetical protein CFBP5477_009990 [Agrobacterium larrymoorei]